MFVTIYELLGMIKDGKAPKKIKYINLIWEYDEETKDYFNDGLWLIYSMNSIGLTEREVEILEEEKKIPEKLDLPKKFEISGCNVRIGSLGFVPTESAVIDGVLSKINDIIDYLHYLKSKGE